jgi:hypothetical protein
VTLEPDQPHPARFRDALGQLRLAGAGRPFDKYRLVQPLGEMHHSGYPRTRHIPDAGQAAGDLGSGVEHGRCRFPVIWRQRPEASAVWQLLYLLL